jgi:hypothetical protein
VSTAGAGGTANDASVDTTRTANVQADLDTYADDAEKAVETIEAKLAGMKASLAAAKTEAKRARAEADKAEDN